MATLSRRGNRGDRQRSSGSRPRTCPRWKRAWAARISPWSRIGEDDEDSFGPIAYLVQSGRGARPRARARAERARCARKGWNSALSSLDARSRRIIEARWLRETDTATLHELADEFGVSAERIRQIETKAMKKMRALIRRCCRLIRGLTQKRRLRAAFSFGGSSRMSVRSAVRAHAVDAKPPICSCCLANSRSPRSSPAIPLQQHVQSCANTSAPCRSLRRGAICLAIEMKYRRSGRPCSCAARCGSSG